VSSLSQDGILLRESHPSFESSNTFPLRAFTNKKKNMLVTIATILVILWVLGLVTSYTVGGFIHVLLVIAIIMFLIRIIKGQRPIA
jgi:hypothetical protein